MKYLIFLISFTLFASDIDPLKEKDTYRKVFKDLHQLKLIKIDDPISDKPVNLKLIIGLDKKGKKIGYIREVSTSTGCQSECLPVIFTLYYDAKGSFIRLLSRPGLTKKYHEEFEEADYIALESILLRAPKIFNQVTHPKQMVDGITSATLKEYSPHVIARAAYTSLRVHLYNQHTIKFIKKLTK